MRTSGYAIVPRLLSSAESHRILEEVSSPAVHATKAGARHLLSVPAVAELACDDRLRGLASEVLETVAVPFRATFFSKAPDANWAVVWHQDTALPLKNRFDAPGWGPWSTKAGVLYAHAPAAALEQVVALRVHLDDSSTTNGPLRVIPGTHLHGVLSDDEVGEIARLKPSTECLAPQGGVVIMRPLLIHASAKIIEPKPRRVIHIEYATRFALGPGIELAAA